MAQSQTPAKSDTVEITTNIGSITILLFDKEAPITTKNFLAYVDTGFYSGLIFHRVMRGFMIQGGGFTRSMSKRQAVFPPIKNESDNGLSNERGTLAMARLQDPNSASSQFFINLVNNARLDYSSGNWGYAVFGKVIDGMEIVDKIASVKTETKGMYENVPADPIIIISAKRK